MYSSQALEWKLYIQFHKILKNFEHWADIREKFVCPKVNLNRLKVVQTNCMAECSYLQMRVFGGGGEEDYSMDGENSNLVRKPTIFIAYTSVNFI